MSSLTATTRYYNAELIRHIENEFRQALKEHNKEYASYLETRLGELYGYFMNKYAGTSDSHISKKQKKTHEDQNKMDSEAAGINLHL